MPSTETPLDGSLAWWDENIRAFWGFVSSCEWVVASPPGRRRGPHRRGVVGLTARRRRRSVHRLAKMASRRRFGALVYTVAPWAWVVGSLGIAIVYTNGRIGPLRAVLGRLCTLLGREGRASCNASCIGWHEHPNHHDVPAAPPRWPTSPLVGKTGSARQALRKWRHRQVDVFPKRQPT